QRHPAALPHGFARMPGAPPGSRGQAATPLRSAFASVRSARKTPATGPGSPRRPESRPGRRPRQQFGTFAHPQRGPALLWGCPTEDRWVTAVEVALPCPSAGDTRGPCLEDLVSASADGDVI